MRKRKSKNKTIHFIAWIVLVELLSFGCASKVCTIKRMDVANYRTYSREKITILKKEERYDFHISARSVLSGKLKKSIIKNYFAFRDSGYIYIGYTSEKKVFRIKIDQTHRIPGTITVLPDLTNSDNTLVLKNKLVSDTLIRYNNLIFDCYKIELSDRKNPQDLMLEKESLLPIMIVKYEINNADSDSKASSIITEIWHLTSINTKKIKSN